MFNPHTARTVALVLAILLTWAPAGCQAPVPQAEPIPQPPAPAAGIEPADQQAATDGGVIAWAADGVITPGEYQKNKSFGDFELHWTTDDLYLYMGMKAKTAGWVAVGFDPSSLMKDADIVQGFVKDGALSIADQYSTGQFGPHPADTQLGGTDDMLASGGKSDSGYTTIEFKRKLDTGDKYDKPLHKGSNKIIWAYGSDPQFTIKHFARGSGQIGL